MRQQSVRRGPISSRSMPTAWLVAGISRFVEINRQLGEFGLPEKAVKGHPNEPLAGFLLERLQAPFPARGEEQCAGWKAITSEISSMDGPGSSGC